MYYGFQYFPLQNKCVKFKVKRKVDFQTSVSKFKQHSSLYTVVSAMVGRADYDA